jgi:hypothetical protein
MSHQSDISIDFTFSLSIPFVQSFAIVYMSKPIRRPIAGPRRPIAGSSNAVRKPVAGSRAGTNARPADEGYLYVAGVRDASQRVSEFRVCLLPHIIVIMGMLMDSGRK